MIGIPVSAVIVGAILLGLLISTWDGLVVDDYYKKGKEINRVLTRDQVATDRGLSAAFTIASAPDGISSADASVEMTLQVYSTRPNIVHDPGLALRFFHRTRSGMDREVDMVHTGKGVYEGLSQSIPSGLWRVQIDSPQWRLVSSARMPFLGRLRFSSVPL